MVQEEQTRFTGDAEVHRFPRLIEPASILNPNKAVMTLDASGKILTVNDMATIFLGEDLMQERTSILDLFPYTSDVSCIKENLTKGTFYNGTPLSDTKRDADLKVAAEEDVLEEEGIVVFSGNVVTVDTDMGEMPVSLWMKELPLTNEEDAKWIAVLEPINITVSMVKINKEGQLLSVDEKFGVIFGSEAVIDNDNLYKYISLSKPCDEITEENYVDQPCTVTTKDGETFPLCVTIRPRLEEESSTEQCYDVKIKLFSNISGLMVVNEKCEIQQYNHNFTRLLLGYGSKELEGENIKQILPDFDEISCKNLSKKELFKIDKDTTGPRDYNYTNSVVNGVGIPYIDESLKENERDEFDGYLHQMKKRSERAENERNANSEGSTIDTPNQGFVISESDSQFTFSLSNFQKSTGNFTVSNPSFNQTVSKEETETPPAVGSPTQNSNFSPYAMRDITNSMNVLNLTEQPDQTRFPLNLGLVTSTPAVSKQNENLTIQEGAYFCTAKHKDGSSIPVLYQIRRMFLNGKDQYCIWIVWEPNENTCEESRQRNDSISSVTPTNRSLGTSVLKDSSQNLSENASPSDLKKSPCSECKSRCEDSLDIDSEDEESTHSMTRTDGSSANDYSLSQSVSEFKPRSFSENDILVTAKGRSGRNHTFEDPEWILTKGEYNDHYTVLKQIGKGAFGFVRLSYKRDSGLIVVTKFIKKSQVYNDSWIEDPVTGKKVCLEVDLLMKLDHPNIVKGMTFYENDKYFQLVMEKWGSGMDLFEFIERDPALDESLISHIFRQIVSPLVYLKSLNIIHRDIKDENIIINERFHIKLIDFGSAAYLKEGKKFSQFAGTIEYCSPEVLKGKKYSGPELEVWSLGITLYTIICGENPFNTVSEVLHSPFVISHNYTEDLFSLLSGMLKKDPKERMNLDEVSAHSWTNQKVDLELYSFEDIVPCDIDELSPPKFINDCSGREDSLSTTSSSFVYEDRQSFSAKEGSILQSPNSAKELAYDGVESAKNDDITECSSRTSSSRSASSYKSSVTIDSSVFFGSRNNVRKDTCSSSVSDATETSFEIHSQTQSVTSSESKSSNFFVPAAEDNNRERTWTISSSHSSRSSTSSDTSVTSIYSDDSTSSDSEEEDDIDELSSSSSSSSLSSTSSSSSSSSSNFISQETVSADSGSDDNTLENTYTNILALEKEEKE